MSDSETENAEGVGDKLTNIEDKLDTLESRIENLEDRTKTKVRVVDTDRGKRIILENRQQTWFSPNYFRKILENIGEEAEDAEEDSGEEVRLEG
ncbi:MAG: hypothetical protein SVV03_05975 [Candidatus Nanohaloarchaea archaeon]|nr:hypothetical protein [Candidatus Nanohaloarchaea archaeon]